MNDWRKIKGNGSMPAGEWKRASPLLTVQGVHYRKSDALAFSKAALRLHEQGKSFGLLIEREPDNSIDRNALKVVGWTAGVSRHVGYVDAIEAARSAERFPQAHLAAEFYSLYMSGGGYIDIRFFLSVPAGEQPRASGRVRSLLELARDELQVMSYAARADNKLGRLENDVLNRYALERAREFRISLVDHDLSDIKRWCKNHSPTSEDVRASIHRLSDDPDYSFGDLWDLIEIVLGIDGKISKVELLVAEELSSFIKEATTSRSV